MTRRRRRTRQRRCLVACGVVAATVAMGIFFTVGAAVAYWVFSTNTSLPVAMADTLPQGATPSATLASPSPPAVTITFPTKYTFGGTEITSYSLTRYDAYTDAKRRVDQWDLCCRRGRGLLQRFSWSRFVGVHRHADLRNHLARAAEYREQPRFHIDSHRPRSCQWCRRFVRPGLRPGLRRLHGPDRDGGAGGCHHRFGRDHRPEWSGHVGLHRSVVAEGRPERGGVRWKPLGNVGRPLHGRPGRQPVVIQRDGRCYRPVSDRCRIRWRDGGVGHFRRVTGHPRSRQPAGGRRRHLVRPIHGAQLPERTADHHRQ